MPAVQEVSGRPEKFEIGPLSFRTWAADVRYVRWGGLEIIRRIFVTLRDDAWREVPPTSWSQTADADHDTLTLRLTARYVQAGIDFAWQGNFEVDVAQRHLSFSMTGDVGQDMEVNRLGLVVLHPQQALIGGSVTVASPSGTETLEIGERIHPQVIVDGLPTGMTAPFDRMTADMPQGGSLRFRFSGEQFEIEDQRNFGDSSFKSYCPPLGGGFPVWFPMGDQLERAVTCDIDLPAGGQSPRDEAHSRVPLPTDALLPRLGLQVSTSEEATGWSASFDYLRVDVAADAADDIAALVDTGARDHGLELGLVIGSEEGLDDRQRSAIGAARHPLRVLLLAASGTVLDVDAAALPVRVLGDVDRNLPIYTAVNGYFVEVNRGIPVDASGRGIALAVCPTVHSGDVLTVAENVAALPYLVQSARDLFPGRELALSPLTLRQGPAPDPDVYAHIGLPWFVAALVTLARAGVSSVTLGNDLLPPSDDLQLARAWVGVLDLVAEARGARSVALDEPTELLYVLAWRPNGGSHVEALVANLSDDVQWYVPDRSFAGSPRTRTLWEPALPHSSGHTPASDFNNLVVPAFGVSHLQMRS